MRTECLIYFQFFQSYNTKLNLLVIMLFFSR